MVQAADRRRDVLLHGPIVLFVAAVALAGCGGQGAGDATPIPSTGVPVAAVGARGVDAMATTAPPPTPIDPHAWPFGSGTAPTPVPPPPDPFAPPVAPPVVPPSPTSTGVPL